MTAIVTTEPPLTEGIAFAAARLVDDHQAPRQPTHYDLERIIKECSLEIATQIGDLVSLSARPSASGSSCFTPLSMTRRRAGVLFASS
jgi:hypothetical protein